MPGSTFSIAGPNTILNTIVAEELEQFADELEGADDLSRAVFRLIKREYGNHKRIVFNGNNYSDVWVKEAKKRGLLNLVSTPEAIPCFKDKKNIDLFKKHNIYSETEIESRCEILLENYCKIINIEALTMVDMINKEIMPAVMRYSKDLADSAAAKKAVCPTLSCKAECALAETVSSLTDKLYDKTGELSDAIEKAHGGKDIEKRALFCRDKVLLAMREARSTADELETKVSGDYWPFPTYEDLLFRI